MGQTGKVRSCGGESVGETSSDCFSMLNNCKKVKGKWSAKSGDVSEGAEVLRKEKYKMVAQASWEFRYWLLGGWMLNEWFVAIPCKVMPVSVGVANKGRNERIQTYF